MVLHENWSVSPQYLAELQNMAKAKLMKLIEDKAFFGGLPEKYMESENKKIYARINSKEAKRLTKSVKP